MVALRHGSDGTDGVNDVVADVSTLSWVNLLLGTIWPKANTALIKYVHDELTPRLRDVLPGPFKRLRFARISLGNNVPEFGPIEVQRHSDSHVQVELDMRYFSDVDVLVETGTAGISFGISQLTFVGRLCIALKPLLEMSPVVGAMHMFFASQPRIELKFAGLAQAVNEVPGLGQKFYSAIDDFIRNVMVLPNARSFHFTRDEGIMDLTQAASQPPLGVLRVRVRSARNLAGANWQFGQVDRFTSDPYCVFRLGHSTARSSSVSGSTDPQWPTTEPSSFFVVYHHEQELEITVFQEEQGRLLRRNFVGLLGKMPATSVRSLLRRAGAETMPLGSKEPPTVRIELDTSQVNRGMLHINDPVNLGVPSELEFELEWFDLAKSEVELGPQIMRFDSALPSRTSLPSVGLIGALMVELHNGAGFPEEIAVKKKGLRWQCRLEDQAPVQSKRGEVYFEEPEFGLPLHPKLFFVIDQLFEYGEQIPEIAAICDTEPDVISSYLQMRRDWQAKVEERTREAGEEQCVELRWHETMSLIVQRPSESSLAIDLLDGDDKVVGHLSAISLQTVMHEGGILARKTSKLNPREAECPKTGFLSGLLFPSCNKPTLASHSRYRAVRMDFSVRFQPLVAGTLPRTAVAGLDAAGAAASMPATAPVPARPPSAQHGYPGPTPTTMNGAAIPAAS
eukprot:CAMPEP_0117480416 /NCGR_PEP_ID=MMETSP0784-20121206/12380_1 /TAXON_ID=39447 /ORGANISM="" /LENGTH=678 /DNA_ID=CAMNT_0005274855 /DNA_START=24 /DNA_END=2060 /DNA_ORIENTATION=+